MLRHSTMSSPLTALLLHCFIAFMPCADLIGLDKGL